MKNSEFVVKIGLNDAEGNEQMRLYDYSAPPLQSGKYTLETTQNVVWAKKGINQSFDKVQQFVVDGARFTLDPSHVYSIFPPANKGGNYNFYLPHVVLTKKTLPWERTVDNNSPEKHTPWMALLLFNSSEIWKDKPVGKAVNAMLDKIINPESNIVVPDFDKSGLDRAQQFLMIDVPKSLFLQVAPQRDELRYLAHCREVDMANKELRADISEGWFSVLVGNRFPTQASAGFDGLNYACLVSLEGLGEYLTGGSKTIPNDAAVRMAVLASWSFTALAQQGETFGNLVQNIDSAPLSFPLPKTSPATDEEKLVAAALHDGYTALNYLTRQGEKTAAWYRGPFTPVPRPFKKSEPYFSSEAGMIYDVKTGLFDVSYAVAWQIGRLLALSDTSFAVGLMKWKQKQKVNQNVLLEQQNTLKRMPGMLAEGSKSLLEAEPGDMNIIANLIDNFLKVDFMPMVSPVRGGDNPLLIVADPTGTAAKAADMPGLLSKDQMAELLTHGAFIKNRLQQILQSTPNTEKGE
jgi:hypothetical protein